MSTETGTYTVRSIRADEWPAVKALRLRALQDPVAHLAFVDTYDSAAARPDGYWQERTIGAAEESVSARQFVVVAPGGEWVGSAAVLVEAGGSTDWAGFAVEQDQGHIVGVYVRPEYRGRGLTERLFAAALDWAWEAGLHRVRLIVHEENTHAQGFYRKAGFQATGVVVPLKGQDGREDARELEFAITRDAVREAPESGSA
ncbi:GNAT family N-acetyltransferase [Streptomyces sp. NPDC008150]|uniref:GNAT family N-acetyltransferase n=1 Tax=Streptomyces sp. NPDC008150 TaxID=3364816 RepID=UPI0036E54C44